MIRWGPELAIYAMWVAWMVGWNIAAFSTAKSVARSRTPWIVPFLIASIVGFSLLLGVFVVHGKPMCVFGCRQWDAGENANWAFTALAAIGFLFMVWARVHLGKLWSGGVTRREGHRVVDTGPYAIVRHPIYNGLIIAMLGTVLVRGTALALAGFAVLTMTYVIKARLEERFLRDELGADAYDAYARRVPMLLPWGAKSS
jgi:protein-S-isoprenylcysteine O-methyltransferase Ste14